MANNLSTRLTTTKTSLHPRETMQRKGKTHSWSLWLPSCQSPYPPHAFCPLPIMMIVLICRLQPGMQRFHTWLVYVTVPVQKGSEAEKTGTLCRVVFLSSAFKSTLQRAPLRPLMHPVHLAKQSCETQDHRHGQKQFHSLIEPIATLHFRGNSNLIYVTVHVEYTCSAFYKKNIHLKEFPTLETCYFNNISVL